MMLKEKVGIQLDIGCGANKVGPNWVGIDVRPLPGVDIVHDLNQYPWPIENDSVLRAVCSHLVEHIPPHAPDPRLTKLIGLLVNQQLISEPEAEDWLGDWQDTTPRFVRFMNEVWRILLPDGELAIVTPHALSVGFPQDPTHCNPINEATWAYFDPLEQHAGGMLYRIYRPKPWKLEQLRWNPAGNIEVLMRKRREDASYYDN